MNVTSEKSTITRAEVLEKVADAYTGLNAAQRRLRGRDAMQPGELSFAQYRLLRPLSLIEALPSGELAAAAGLTAATTTHMLDQLAGAGIVQRERSMEDRRVVMTGLTQEGKNRVERKRAYLHQRWDESLSDLNEDELLRAAVALERMTRFVDGL